MNPRAVLFDLDGTLADTLADIAAAANHALESVGRPTLPVEQYRYLAGQGVDYLIIHALGRLHVNKGPRCRQAYLDYYAQHKFEHTELFDGIADLLDELTTRRVRLGILSNKPDAATQDMVNHLFGKWRFDVVRGAMDGTPLKPDPSAAISISTDLRIAAPQWLYVGDTAADMRAGTGAGMFTVGVTWGFRDESELREHGADAIIHQPGELLRYFE